jgi:hypothetical protein
MTTPDASHLPQELLARVYTALVVLFPDSTFEPLWREASKRFEKWHRGLPAPVSGLTEALYLIELLCEYFDPVTIKSDQNLIRVVLEGTVEANNCVEIGAERYEVLRREIGSNFGVAYTLRDEKGKIIRHEFFD